MPEERKKKFNPKDSKHIVKVSGQEFITYVGLQARLQDQGKSIVGVDTEVVQVPHPDNGDTAVVTSKVTVIGRDAEGREFGPYEFRCIGDASPDSVGKAIKPHIIRMAETRAIARALRIITRSEYTALDEVVRDFGGKQNSMTQDTSKVA